MFESVHRRGTHARTNGWTPARLLFYKLTSELSAMEAYMDLQLSSCFYFNYTYEVGLMPKITQNVDILK